LRTLGMVALKRYQIRVKSMRFINHGENTTFCVTAATGQRYLLRIHRHGYHSALAIQQELRWLTSLAKSSLLQVPVPVPSKAQRLVECVAAAGVGQPRFCCLFRWVEGRFIHKSLRPEHLFKLGQTVAKLQKSSQHLASHHRRYWGAEGLLGRRPKFGAIDHLQGASAKQLAVLTRVRREILGRLKRLERTHPEKMGLVHADFHFGNLLLINGEVGVIDFDDCGFGFYAYDLAVPVIAAEWILGKTRRAELAEYRAALVAGYSSLASWTPSDDHLLDDLILTRRLVMLGWLNTRSDNPRLKTRLKRAIAGVVRYAKM
jgi:Ser/Thr protein kinase RdoA (MazF antagonist)